MPGPITCISIIAKKLYPFRGIFVKRNYCELRITNYDLRIMKTNNIVQLKSYSFTVRIVKVYQYLSDEKKEFILSKQLLRSGTSIGANVEEAIGG